MPEGGAPVSSFRRALEFVLRWEGGYVNHPDDRGGATNQGITQAAYDRARRRWGLPTRDVRLLEDDERDRVYHEDYWIPGACELLRWPASLAQLDASVLHGPTRAVILLQRALGVGDDGIAGPVTRAAASRALSMEVLYREMMVYRHFYYWDIFLNPNHGVTQLRSFGRGWRNRMADLHRMGGQAFNHSIIDRPLVPVGTQNAALLGSRRIQ